MWIQKSAKELKAERRSRFAASVLYGTTVIFLVALFTLPHAGFNIPAYVRILGMLAVGILLLAWYSRAHWSHLRSGIVICEQCNLVKVNQAEGKCACGGTLLPLPKMKWAEEWPSTTAPTSSLPSPDYRPVHETLLVH